MVSCVAWVYADETTEAILQLFEEIRIHGAWVPGLWRRKVPLAALDRDLRAAAIKDGVQLLGA
jgi:hypothetical protein